MSLIPRHHRITWSLFVKPVCSVLDIGIIRSEAILIEEKCHSINHPIILVIAFVLLTQMLLQKDIEPIVYSYADIQGVLYFSLEMT